MRRRLISVASALSFLLCVATLSLWARSLFIADEWTWIKAQTTGTLHFRWYLVLDSGRGGLGICHDAEISEAANISSAAAAEAGKGWRFAGWNRDRPTSYPSPAFLSNSAPPSGFLLVWTSSSSFSAVRHDLIVPDWAVAILAGFLPGLRLEASRRRWKKIQRLRQGLCPNCGYDIRVTPDRCPECGASVHLTKP